MELLTRKKVKYVQGRNEVRWRPGQKNKFGAPMVEPVLFRKQVYYIEESTCEIVAFSAAPAVIRRPRSDSVPP